MNKLSVDELKSELAKNGATVTFKKADGSSRTYLGSTRYVPHLEAPPVVEGEERKSRKQSDPNVIKLFVPSVKAWRSFRYERIVSVDPVNVYSGFDFTEYLSCSIKDGVWSHTIVDPTSDFDFSRLLVSSSIVYAKSSQVWYLLQDGDATVADEVEVSVNMIKVGKNEPRKIL